MGGTCRAAERSGNQRAGGTDDQRLPVERVALVGLEMERCVNVAVHAGHGVGLRRLGGSDMEYQVSTRIAPSGSGSGWRL